jgi:hypothetical protein
MITDLDRNKEELTDKTELIAFNKLKGKPIRKEDSIETPLHLSYTKTVRLTKY